MNLPQMSPDGAGRPRWLKIAAGVWLVLVSAIACLRDGPAGATPSASWTRHG